MSASDLRENYIPRLLTAYRDEISPKLKEKFNYDNVNAIPRIKKIVVNMGLGEGSSDSKIVDQAAVELAAITGQKAKICRSRKPISNFKLREGAPIGCCVTMRRYRMYEFLDRLITVTFPRIRDFRGFSANSFDGQGNYTFGLTEQSMFAELNLDKISRSVGMNISIATNANTDEEARELLRLFGFPFRR